MSASILWAEPKQMEYWKLTQDKAISYILDGLYVFYIEKPGGLRLDVIVARARTAATLRPSRIESNRINFCLCQLVPRLRRNVSGTF